MANNPLHVTAVDKTDGHFVVYFSDETFTKLSAEDLAQFFPERNRQPDVHEPDEE